jgi:hypothetical protein
MSNTHEHLEHAEHAEHNSHDPFNQRVAVSMAIVAALLAAISMVGHRTHNKVLQLQNESNRYRTEAATAEVEKSNLFAWYQSKRLRQASFQVSATSAELMPVTNEEARKKAVAEWKKKANEYDQSNKGTDPANPEGDNLPDLKRRGEEATARAAEAKKTAQVIRAEAEHVHHQADRFDVAHLSSEIGLVLCSIALLTRKKAYWFIGLGAAVVALGLTVSAYTIPQHESEHPDEPIRTAPAEKEKTH